MNKSIAMESRLDKLEQDNRRLKLALGLLLLVLTAIPLVGAVMPQQTPEMITAQGFYVIDENGTRRAGMNAAGIAYWDYNGAPRVMMHTDGIRYNDENGSVIWSTPPR
ncbi:MAG: hypothetical protein CL485_07380 [Acidobacteria bacterium]|jgi:hypothetical protein|nr:hypothetical protein [Acidobacteriota bacterium]MEE3150811.1 hypothetical protein [Acidobacteriota bacterium]|tara:strand:- start:1767 stop:2090 length:324 start_codon:yes stop_codon:yes gene_type:complete